MKNSFIYKLKTTIEIKVTGKNIERFIRKLIKEKIELLNIDYIKYNEIIIQIYKKDFTRIEEIKTIYDIEILRYHGIYKIKKIIEKNKYLLTSILIGFLIIYLLSNIIFSVEVIHSDSEFRKFLTEQLEEKGIKKYQFVKNYHEIQKIKKELLIEYKDKIDWLEIERVGTKYVIRVEERILNEKKQNKVNQNIIASKSGIIKKIEAKEGQIVKNKNDYVKKGDVIISGNIYLNEDIKDTVSANGKVFAETWYKVTIEYPLKYKEIKKTGNKKNVYTFKFLNKYYDLFNFKKYKTKLTKDKVLLKNNILPFSFIKQQQIETIVINEKYSKKEAINKAIQKAANKIKTKLKKEESILSYKIINEDINKDVVILEIFFSVYEDITDYQKIIEMPKIENN